MPIKDKGKHPLGDKELRSLPGSRLNRKRLAGKTTVARSDPRAGVPKPERNRTRGLSEQVAVRYHREQKLTHKEHQSYVDLKAIEIKTGVPRTPDKVPVLRAAPDRKEVRLARRTLAKVGRIDKRNERSKARRLAKAQASGVNHD